MSATRNEGVRAELLEEAKVVAAAVREAARDARTAHKKSGDPIVIWRNGRVEWIPADEIQVDMPPRDKCEQD